MRTHGGESAGFVGDGRRGYEVCPSAADFAGSLGGLPASSSCAKVLAHPVVSDTPVLAFGSKPAAATFGLVIRRAVAGGPGPGRSCFDEADRSPRSCEEERGDNSREARANDDVIKLRLQRIGPRKEWIP